MSLQAENLKLGYDKAEVSTHHFCQDRFTQRRKTNMIAQNFPPNLFCDINCKIMFKMKICMVRGFQYCGTKMILFGSVISLLALD
jgi:hypothetical protein